MIRREKRTFGDENLERETWNERSEARIRVESENEGRRERTDDRERRSS